MIVLLLAGLARAQDNPLPDEPVIVDELVNEVSRPGEPPFAEDDTDEALVQRLLGPTEEEASAAGPAQRSPLDLDLAGLWPLALALGGMGLLWLARGRTGARSPFQTQLMVVGKTSLGGSSSLMLIDVAQPGGSMRRLVIATGSGTPALLADLGDDAPSEEEEERRREPQSETSEPEMRPPVGRAATYAANAHGGPGPGTDQRKAAALALIHEVVGTRTGRS